MHLPHLILKVNSYIAIIFISCAIKFSICSSTGRHYLQEFYSKNVLQDGVHELLLYFDGIRVKESIVGPKEGSQRGIVVRQLSNQKQLVTLVYNGIPPYLRREEAFKEEGDADEASLLGTDEEGLKIRECRVEKSPEEVEKFVEEFDKMATELRERSSSLDDSGTNSTYRYLGDRSLQEIPHHILTIAKFNELKHKCFKLNRKVRKIAKSEARRIQRQQNETSVLNRQRRGVTNLLSVPNTKWCGTGYSAKSYDELGGLYGADSCCRQHDLHCPFFIQSFERKYGYFHFGLGTISHCSCDRRFKTCLKQIGTGAADVVGNVFFSLVKASCFDFQQKKVCKKRGFWSCLRWGYEKQAVIRNPISWT